MQINNFKIQVLNDFKSFHMLEEINGDSESVFLFKETPEGRSEITNFQAYRMADNSVLVAFFSDIEPGQDYNYVAVSESTEEVLSTQIFERVINIYKKPPSNEDGAFFFVNSLPILADAITGRCDMTKLGPSRFTSDGSHGKPLFDDVSQIITFEPLLSVNGVGHVLFIHLKDDAEIANTVINNFEIPSSTRTLSELFKLIIEWQQTTEEPFNNSSPIAINAKKFLELVNMDEQIINHIESSQVNMQVANYLLGSETARVRPDNVVAMTNEIENWLVPKFSFMTLSKLLQFYPTSWDKQEVLVKEKELFNDRLSSHFSKYGMTYYENSLNDIDYCVETAMASGNIHNSARGFLTLYFNLLKTKRDILNSL